MLDGRNNEIFFHNNSISFPEELSSFVPAIQCGRGANPLFLWWKQDAFSTVVNNITFSFNPSTPKSDQFQISPAAAPEIWHHTVRRTWLSIAYSDKTVDDYISLTLSLPRVINFKFPCSLTRNITSHSMKNLAFHSLLRWEMIILPILTTSFIHFSLGRLGECTFWTWDWKGCRTLLKTTLGWRRPPG